MKIFLNLKGIKVNCQKFFVWKKRNYYEREFEKVRFSPKKTWFLINKCLIKRKDQSFPDEMCMPENQVPLNDKKEIADALNRHSAKIGERLLSLLPHQGQVVKIKMTRNFLPPSHDKSIFLTPVSEQELKNVVTLLKNGHSEGIDGSSTFLLKEILPQISHILCHIINLAFKNGTFPSSLKDSRILALYKGGEKTNPSNYRPISLLFFAPPAFPKIIELCLYNRIVRFLDHFEMINNLEFRFRKCHSTDHAVLLLTQYVHDILDRGEIPASIFLDIKKAFDLISHDILMHKLDHYGIRGPAKSLIASYIKDCSHYVDGGDVSSEMARQSNTAGVLQVSILGALLFLIYVNDLNNSMRIFGLNLQSADDTACTVVGKDVSCLKLALEEAFNHLLLWLESNYLALNADKTKFVVFSRCNARKWMLYLFKEVFSILCITNLSSQPGSGHFVNYFVNKMNLNLNLEKWIYRFNEVPGKCFECHTFARI